MSSAEQAWADAQLPAKQTPRDMSPFSPRDALLRSLAMNGSPFSGASPSPIVDQDAQRREYFRGLIAKAMA